MREQECVIWSVVAGGSPKPRQVTRKDRDVHDNALAMRKRRSLRGRLNAIIGFLGMIPMIATGNR